MTATVVRGTNTKPAASESLVEVFASDSSLDGQLFVGYPIIGSAEGRYPIDAVLVSPQMGIVVFDLVESPARLDGYQDRQDDAATKLVSKLLTHRELVQRRTLRIPVQSLSYVPGAADRVVSNGNDYPIANANTIRRELAQFSWAYDDAIYHRALSAIQSISTIRRSRSTRSAARADSRGSKLKRLEDSIATLDNLQSKAVIETIDGVQRIRGLAGSGKT
ncbi:MAG TPA: hypothetical protein VNT52_16950, partial [Acidimicrobiales bacterium]|nr:hypothetical protein [Acidimicrobiales bacterium]